MSQRRATGGGGSLVAARRMIATRLVIVIVVGWLLLTPPVAAQVRLADASDRSAFQAWFVLLADAQFERQAPDVVDCAALIRFAFREALRPHTAEWSRRISLPFAPSFPDVRSAPAPTTKGWALFRVSATTPARYAEFADARTIITLNSRPLGRDAAAARPGDLLYFRQPGQTQPDHLMVFVGRSFFDREGADWVVYHTGPSDDGPGEVRKVRLRDLRQHPSPRWRPLTANPHFVGLFRLAPL
jgi:uncharacterized protein YfaT (DUF1175 family)